MHPKDADRMANKVDHDKIGSTLFAQTCLTNTKGRQGITYYNILDLYKFIELFLGLT